MMSVFGDDKLFEEFEIQSDKPDQSDSISESDTENDNERDEKYKTLLAENEKLKRALRILERPELIRVKDACKDGPIAHVVLFNHNISRKFKEEILDFFCELCSRRVKDSDAFPEIKQPFVQYLPPRGEKTTKRSAKRADTVTKAFQGFNSIQVYDKFFIDHLGQPLYFQDPAHSDWVHPKYESADFQPLSGDFESSVRQKKRIQRICFNCGSTDHQMKDCEKPRDHQVINDRRQKFMNDVAKYSQGLPQIRLDGPRYHEDDDGTETDKEKFAKFKPGIISAELQEALGMKEDDLPPYIYQMRRLGYPPGHLHSAKVVNSGLLLYEEGEINGRIQGNEYAPVDVDKIIGYPGFNQPPLPGQQDKSEEHGVLPIDYQQSKEVMISYFEHRNAIYNQKQIEDQNRKHREKQGRDDVVIEEVDMEVAEDEDGVDMHISDDEAPVDLEEGEVQESKASTFNIVDDVGNLTENELEMQREFLLKELQRSNENNNDSDYRNIRSNDQDYRIIESEFHEKVAEDTPQSPDENFLGCETQTQDIAKSDVIDLTNESTDEATSAGLKGRSLSSDTDYRVPPTIHLEEHLVVKVESPAASSSHSTIASPKIDDEVPQDNDKKLPERQKFAKGISKFDAYFSESKSQGVYDKLRLLLKESPRRQEK